MPDETHSDNDLFHEAPADPAPPVKASAPAPKSSKATLDELKAKFENLVHKHFPANFSTDGAEAHQPLRAFLLDVHSLL